MYVTALLLFSYLLWLRLSADTTTRLLSILVRNAQELSCPSSGRACGTVESGSGDLLSSFSFLELLAACYGAVVQEKPITLRITTSMCLKACHCSYLFGSMLFYSSALRVHSFYPLYTLLIHVVTLVVNVGGFGVDQATTMEFIMVRRSDIGEQVICAAFGMPFG